MIKKHSLKLILNIPTTPVQTLPHGGGYQPYNPAAVAYNNDRGGNGEEDAADDEQEPYYRGQPYQYYPQQPPQLAHGRYGYHSSPTHSEDTELRSPGVARRFPRDVIMKEDVRGRMDSPEGLERRTPKQTETQK